MDDNDRISQLPEQILDHVIYFLPQKDAVGTCILSKSWRHLGPTRPKIEFHEKSFGGKKQKLLSVLENTLQRYDNQKLSIHEFNLEMSESDSETISLLNKWIPIVLLNMGVKTFNLTAHRFKIEFSLPSVVFQSELLEELFLKGCKLDKIFNSVQVLKRLRTLSLDSVFIEEETFEKIMSSCPLIQRLVLGSCWRLSTVRVNNALNLRHIDCKRIYSIEIVDAPSLETIRINYCKNGFHLHNNCFYPRLKSLYLQEVHLPSTELFNNLSSNNFPCLEVLELHYCSGFNEFKLLNRSITRLIINVTCRPIEVAIIDVPNILYFEYRSEYLPSLFSFSTTSREWESCIEVCPSDSNTTWLHKMYEILKALSQSQISFYTSYFPLTNQDTTFGGNIREPVVVEHLYLRERYYQVYEDPALLNCMFHICRPRYIGVSFYADSQKIYGSQLAESLWKTLVNKGETRQCHFWQQDLEESSIQVLEENAHEWCRGQVCDFSNKEYIRFRLKWRDLS